MSALRAFNTAPTTLTDEQVGMLAYVDDGLGERAFARRAGFREKTSQLAETAAASEPLAFAVFTYVQDIVGPLLKAQRTMVREQEQRIQALETGSSYLMARVVDELRKRFDAMQKQIAELEQQPSVEYTNVGRDGDVESRLDAMEKRIEAFTWKGVWASDKTYDAGNLCTFGGSTWHANAASRGDRPGTSPAWTLMVKRGADGRDGKDLR